MDICIVTGKYPPLEGGPSSLSFELSRKLVAFGNEVTVITFHTRFKMKYEIDERLTILKLPQPKLVSEKTFYPIIFLLKLFMLTLGLLILKPLKNFKIVDAMDHSLAGIPSVIFAFFTRVPLVVRVHTDLLFHVIVERGWKKSSLPSRIVRILQLIILKMVKRIIAINMFIDNLLRNYGVSSEKIVVIHNAVDISRFRPPQKKEKMKQKLGFKENQELILSVSRLIPSKKLDNLILAFAETCKVIKNDPCLLITGSGPDMERLKSISRTIGINSRIFFLGQVSNEKIHEIYQAVDIFILPSSREIFPITILEAMASGVPTIVARSGGVVSIFTDKKNCLMYEPGNITELKHVLNELITNEKSRKLFAERARRLVVKKYSWDSIAQQTLILYKKSVNKNKNYNFA